ncbi:hypothetical protein BD0135_11440 [Helicobacter pylori]
MGFQNENKLELGASVKATINDKVVEAKVINIGFNRVTLRSEKGNEASYSFNSEKFLKWFNQVELNHAVKSSDENGKKDLLESLKVVRAVLLSSKELLLLKSLKKADLSWTLISLMTLLALLWSLLTLTLTKKEIKDLVCYSRR